MAETFTAFEARAHFLERVARYIDGSEPELFEIPHIVAEGLRVIAAGKDAASTRTISIQTAREIIEHATAIVRCVPMLVDSGDAGAPTREGGGPDLGFSGPASSASDELIERLQAADLTTRHLTEYRAAKMSARDGRSSSPFENCTMVEAIIVWWESGVRDEVLGPALAIRAVSSEEKR